MGYTTEYSTLEADGILNWATQRKAQGWHFVQMCAALAEDGVDLIYTVRKDTQVEIATVNSVASETHVASVTGCWLAAFVFENEAHDLFGVQIDNIAIDFGGKFYNVAVDKPMTVLSPAQIAAREKAAKAAAAKATKAAKAAAEGDKAAKAPLAEKLSPEEIERQKKQALREGRLAAWEAEQVAAKEASNE